MRKCSSCSLATDFVGNIVVKSCVCHFCRVHKVTKSMRKKLEKLHKKHAERWIKEQQVTATPLLPAVLASPSSNAGSSTTRDENAHGADCDSTNSDTAFNNDNARAADGHTLIEPQPPLRVVAGTFGNRQGLRLCAELGPFTHTFAFN